MESKPENGKGTRDPSAERGPTVPTREEALAALKEGVHDNPEAQAVLIRWTEAGEQRRDRREVTQESLTMDSIRLFLEAGLKKEAVEAAEEVLSHFGPPLEAGESPDKGVKPEGDDLYWFCVSVVEDFG